MYKGNCMTKKSKQENIPSKGSKKTKPAKSEAEKFFTETPEERNVRNKEAYADFIRWTILTKAERKTEKAPHTQSEFARKWNININTTTEWQKRDDYEVLRSEMFKKKLATEVPEVMADLRKRIKKYGMAMDVELWLAYAEGWDKKKVVELKPPMQFGLDDVRALVAKLPKEKQKLYYGTIAKLIADATDADEDL